MVPLDATRLPLGGGNAEAGDYGETITALTNGVGAAQTELADHRVVGGTSWSRAAPTTPTRRRRATRPPAVNVIRARVWRDSANRNGGSDLPDHATVRPATR